MMEKVRIELSALGPSISEQCAAQGVVAAGLRVEMLDRLHKAITLAHIHGMLTDAETDRARRRLIRVAKFQRATP